ncbi:transposase [Comamonas thiooxydans]|uniref:Transposase n=1 Tax=Comamonas thiooxydans TaxID=363952 RepID=A0A0E3BM70_9BURK|nr:transposase [Comamonas thiooxydans]KGH03541.1 transposase [Comamonas thiooxydans]KGH17430.1 transposase [Comamonas thiooxydans]KGH18852.1 transposase [Comamonas thiooxydans]
MKKSRFSEAEAQIVGILKEVELGAKVGDACRKHGIMRCHVLQVEEYSGMSVSHLAQMRQLQQENAKLKRMYADLALVHHALKDVVEQKL